MRIDTHERLASLFWRTFGANAIVFIAAAMLLVFTPFTISFPTTLDQAAIIAGGTAVLVLINLALVRRSLEPVRALADTMRSVDPLKPGARVQLDSGDRDITNLVASFNDMLGRLETERRASAHRELSATDAEQRRIAGELHDEIGQQLTLLLLLLANAQADADPQTAARLQEARDVAHHTLDDLRAVVARLRPEALDRLGLRNGLHGLVDRIEKATEAGVTCSIGEVPDDIAPVISLVVYRVAQEALTNAVKHAAANAIVVELGSEPSGALRLRVADDGRGFDPSDGRVDAAGLRWMAERALLIGADLELASSRQGTTVTLTVPSPHA
jgi:two-component system sensor histidine kinase UhpB